MCKYLKRLNYSNVFFFLLLILSFILCCCFSYFTWCSFRSVSRFCFHVYFFFCRFTNWKWCDACVYVSPTNTKLYHMAELCLLSISIPFFFVKLFMYTTNYERQMILCRICRSHMCEFVGISI